MGLQGKHKRKYDLDINSAYFRISSIKKEYPTSGTFTFVRSSVEYGIYANKQMRLDNPHQIIDKKGFMSDTDLQNRSEAYTQLADILQTTTEEI